MQSSMFCSIWEFGMKAPPDKMCSHVISLESCKQTQALSEALPIILLNECELPSCQNSEGQQGDLLFPLFLLSR